MNKNNLDEHLSTIPGSPASLELLEVVFDGVYIVDRKRRILFWNKGAEEITGYSAREVTGKRCADNILNHIDSDGNLLCNSGCPLQKTLDTGKNITRKVYPFKKSGKRIPVITHVSPIKDKANNIVAGIEIFRDISEQEDYRKLQEKFKRMIKKYVSSTTYNEILQQASSDLKTSAKMRDLTILFLDIVDFTGFSEKNAPEEVIDMLNDIFGICEIITEEFSGDIDKFIGDAVLAVFIDANDAISAGQKILKALDKMNEHRIKEEKEAVNVRIGVNSGSLIQSIIGTESRKDITVIGDVVNTAVRIQTIGRENTVTISEATLSRLSKPENFQFVKRTSLKGKEEKIKIFSPKNPA